jgi:hypothetical protein
MRALFVLGCVGGIASPVMAETWECTVIKKKSQKSMPSEVTIKNDPNSGRILISDDFSRSFGRPVIAGRLLEDNVKRQIVSWVLDGLPVGSIENDYKSFKSTKITFRAIRIKANNSLKVIAYPGTWANFQSFARGGKNSCRLKK